MAYTITLFVFALIGQSRGNKVWKTSVAEATFLAHSGAGGPHTTNYQASQPPISMSTTHSPAQV